ncbi:phage virion morphogenesis protein [Geobacter sp.]|uniref:phage virion morphogenesis protein n=1 Tax=Geobacter sp. TaxID=46610 RepID=UPI00260BCB3E|nr:phage virion morphogenesis protein [Geobacter sp.]
MSKELISIEHNVPAIRKQFEKLARKTSNTGPVRKDIGEYLLIATAERFDTQTGPDGEKWRDVTRRTRKRKKHPKILTEQGHLRGDIHYELSNDSLLLGVGIEYGAIHQLGGEIRQEARSGVVTHFKRAGKGQRFSKAKDAHYGMKTNHRAHTIKMPARPYLGVSRADETEIVEIIGGYLKP